MISRDCDACEQLYLCKKRYEKAVKFDKIFCPDGTAHLIDEEGNN